MILHKRPCFQPPTALTTNPVNNPPSLSTDICNVQHRSCNVNRCSPGPVSSQSWKGGRQAERQRSTQQYLVSKYLRSQYITVPGFVSCSSPLHKSETKSTSTYPL